MKRPIEVSLTALLYYILAAILVIFSTWQATLGHTSWWLVLASIGGAIPITLISWGLWHFSPLARDTAIRLSLGFIFTSLLLLLLHGTSLLNQAMIMLLVFFVFTAIGLNTSRTKVAFRGKAAAKTNH